MKKNKEPELIPMSCAVCTSCYREADNFTGQCHFGGPYIGYKILTERKTDTNAPLV